MLDGAAMGPLWLDVRYALRMMAKTPGLTAVLAITLALGIGASTTIFSVVHSVVLRPLPYKDPDRLIRVYTEARGIGASEFPLSPPEYADLREACRTCESVGAWAQGTAALAGGTRPIRVDALAVTHTLLPTIGVQPQLGRLFDASEDRPGDPSVIILGHDLWQRAFNGDPQIIGKTIRFDAMPVTVVGVMPKGFDFLGGVEAWFPGGIDYAKAHRASHNWHVVVRLKPDASYAAFQEELLALRTAWEKDAAKRLTAGEARVHTISDDHPMIAVPFQDNLVGSMAKTLWLLQAAVLFVLLISVVNVANLLLARSETRSREVAVRHALGASRRRLLRQFITESLLLGLLGGGLGVLLAVWAVDGVTALIPRSAPRANEIELDAVAVAFAAGCAVIASLIFGLAPILHAKKTDLHSALKDGGNRMTGSRARLRVRRALVVAEITLAVVLVIGCTVMVKSFVRLQQVELGFDPSHTLTFGVELYEKAYPGTPADATFKRLEERLRALPGVKNATLIGGLPPYRLPNFNDLGFPGRTPDPKDPWNVDYWQWVGTNSIETLGARLVRGRAIAASDTAEAPLVVMVNEAFAAKFFPGQDAIGQKIHVYDDRTTQTIVGIVANMRQGGVDKPPGTEVFVPYYQWPTISLDGKSNPTANILIRTDGDPREMLPAVQRVVADIDPTLPVFQPRTMDDVLWEAVSRPRFLTFLLSCFAGIALLLAAVGIYGVMAHTVAQRTHEIGLRVALGAQPAQVRALVLRQAGTLVAFGVALGLVVAVVLQFLLDRTLAGLFYGARLSEPALLIGVAVVVGVTALLATWIPVRRATRVEPTVALRSE